MNENVNLNFLTEWSFYTILLIYIVFFSFFSVFHLEIKNYQISFNLLKPITAIKQWVECCGYLGFRAVKLSLWISFGSFIIRFLKFCFSRSLKISLPSKRNRGYQPAFFISISIGNLLFDALTKWKRSSSSPGGFSSKSGSCPLQFSTNGENWPAVKIYAYIFYAISTHYYHTIILL